MLSLFKRLTKSDVAFLVCATAFSFWLMFHTFGYDSADSTILISNLIYSDFLSHIPLIRSFSLGQNWPPEFPLYPGEPIRYHFVFYAFAGLLERIGFRLDWAVNLPSALGFLFLLCAMYFGSSRLFADRRVGWIAVIFLLFNGSMAFLTFFKKNPLSTSTLKTIWELKEYPCFGPWDGNEVSAFNNLNIYINQRHLAFSLGFVLCLLLASAWITDKSKKGQITLGLLLGALAGLFPFYHQPALLMAGVVAGSLFILLPRARWFLFSFGASALLFIAPQLPYFFKTAASAGQKVIFYPGYLIYGSLSVGHFFSYWFLNLGLIMVLGAAGIVLSPKKIRLLYVPAGIIFVMAFLFRFGTEAGLNHKFFNFSFLLLQIAAAYALIRLYDAIKRRYTGWKQAAALVPVAMISFFCVFSGIIDAMVIKNRAFYSVVDIPRDDVAKWILENTPPRAVFLNSHYFYNSPSLAGRPILMGWPYFAGGIGYDVNKRTALARTIFAADHPEKLCTLLASMNTSYVIVQNNKGEATFPPINDEYFKKNFKPQYVSQDQRTHLFAVSTLCGPKS